jgi:hypothetical protein
MSGAVAVVWATVAIVDCDSEMNKRDELFPNAKGFGVMDARGCFFSSWMLIKANLFFKET